MTQPSPVAPSWHANPARFDTREQAQLLASRFNLLARKGRQYDNTMKQWR